MKVLLVMCVLTLLTSCTTLSSRSDLETIAVRVHDMDAMVAFYENAFGFSFEPVDTAGLASMFGTNGALTLKFVPLREWPDFEGFPSHQLGFAVDDWARVVDATSAHGGAMFGDVAVLPDGRMHLSVRDPDGNTLEIYGR